MQGQTAEVTDPQLLCLPKSRNENRTLHFERSNADGLHPDQCSKSLTSAVIHCKADVLKGPGTVGCSCDRRWITATRRCGRSDGADRRLLESRQCDWL